MHRKDGNMKTETFNQFVEAVRNADANDPVFYAGYLWTSLTDKQCDATKDALFARLIEKGDCKVRRLFDSRLKIDAPSGIGIILSNSDVGRYATEVAFALETMKGGEN